MAEEERWASHRALAASNVFGERSEAWPVSAMLDTRCRHGVGTDVRECRQGAVAAIEELQVDAVSSQYAAAFASVLIERASKEGIHGLEEVGHAAVMIIDHEMSMITHPNHSRYSDIVPFSRKRNDVLDECVHRRRGREVEDPARGAEGHHESSAWLDVARLGHGRP
ncbi:MAG: hypothetical protein IV100_11315 [Myxococcales bacterium]|nr:hypothetical protein [Myxococcales bacterium]